MEESKNVKKRLVREVVDRGICVSCGVCISEASSPEAKMINRGGVPIPDFASFEEKIGDLVWEACPGKGVDYPRLYRKVFGTMPLDWRIGIVEGLWTGYASNSAIRANAASGGVTTAVLIHLLETNRIDAAVLAKQGVGHPESASFYIAKNKEEILNCAQSIYVPVPMLSSLRDLEPSKRYAITCVPEQAAALRVLQQGGHEKAQQIKFVLGPYTGTALEYGAIRALLRAQGVSDADEIISLKWRAGEWPGHLEIILTSGQVIKSKKVYYNYLIPFFITQSSLQSMDFANEFSDLSVGDAWSPKFESLGRGFSVILSRTKEMTEILQDMEAKGLVELTVADPLEASSMHGHMIDFKKRGGYLRNQVRRKFGLAAPDYGLEPQPIGFARRAIELVIIVIFSACRTTAARWIMQQIPERFIGPLFNRLRLSWKALSKPAKRKDLRELRMKERNAQWRKA